MNTKTNPDDSFEKSLTDDALDELIKLVTGVDPAQRRKELAEKNILEETSHKDNNTKDNESPE